MIKFRKKIVSEFSSPVFGTDKNAAWLSLKCTPGRDVDGITILIWNTPPSVKYFASLTFYAREEKMLKALDWNQLVEMSREGKI